MLQRPLSQLGFTVGDGCHSNQAGVAESIRAGEIVAVKGLGGFQLMVAAHDDKAIRRLRELKHREEKPFALMFPSLEATHLKNTVALSVGRHLFTSQHIGDLETAPGRRKKDPGP